MQDIKRFIKKMGLTQSEFATKLCISRPTLDAYINQFEKTGTLDKERYDIIFKRLFLDEDIEREEFYRRIKSFDYLMNRNQRYSSVDLSIEAADCISKVYNAMIEDMSDEEWDDKIYRALLIVINNYRKDTLLRELLRYISEMNNVIEESITAIDKIYYSYFYEWLKDLRICEPRYIEESYMKFLDTALELKNEKKIKREQVNRAAREELINRIYEVQKEFEDRGKSPEAEEIVNYIMSR